MAAALLFLLALALIASTNKKPTSELLNTPRILTYGRPFYDINQNHVATFQIVKNRSDSFVSNLNTYTLDGTTLKSCHIDTTFLNTNPNFTETGSMTSLGDEHTEVLMWTEDNQNDSYLHLRVINTDSCEYADDIFRITKTGFTETEASDVEAFIVPYDDSFDVVFQSGAEILRARYGADGLIIKNPTKLIKGELSNIESVNPIAKYNKSSDLLVIYVAEKSELTAVLANPECEVLRSKPLLNVTEITSFKYNYFPIYGEVDHGKLVLCNFSSNMIRCERYNATTLESEIRIDFEYEGPFARIHILPDGGFSLLQFGVKEDDTFYFLTTINADGSVQPTIKISTCNVIPMSSYPYVYTKNNVECLVYMCAGVEPFNMPGSNMRPYSTHITCY